MSEGIRARSPWLLTSFCLLFQTTHSRVATAQSDGSDAADAPTYPLRIAVDEVILTFDREDTTGFPVNDLTASDVSLLDNGPSQGAELSLAEELSRPGILVDASTSMRASAPAKRAIGFHTVKLTTPRRFVSVPVRAGYYAPTH